MLAHLGHPLVAQATRLLRSALWGGRTALHRIAAVRFTPPEDTVADGFLVAVFARLVVVGADGRRLHEEVMLAARERARRPAGPAGWSWSSRATPGCGMPWKAPSNRRAAGPLPQSVKTEALAARWPELEPLLAGDVQLRARGTCRGAAAGPGSPAVGRADPRPRRCSRSCAARCETALEAPGPVQLTFDELDQADRQQLERDRHAWEARLDGLGDERERELAVIEPPVRRGPGTGLPVRRGDLRARGADSDGQAPRAASHVGGASEEIRRRHAWLELLQTIRAVPHPPGRAPGVPGRAAAGAR